MTPHTKKILIAILKKEIAEFSSCTEDGGIYYYTECQKALWDLERKNKKLSTPPLAEV